MGRDRTEAMMSKPCRSMLILREETQQLVRRLSLLGSVRRVLNNSGNRSCFIYYTVCAVHEGTAELLL